MYVQPCLMGMIFYLVLFEVQCGCFTKYNRHLSYSFDCLFVCHVYQAFFSLEETDLQSGIVSLVQGLLQIDPLKRLTADEALHTASFLTVTDDSNTTETENVNVKESALLTNDHEVTTTSTVST